MWIAAEHTICDDHAEFMTLAENYPRLSLVTRQQPTFEPLTLYDIGHKINLRDCFTMAIIRLGKPAVCPGLWGNAP